MFSLTNKKLSYYRGTAWLTMSDGWTQQPQQIQR